ncbi:MAG TPA: DUF2842 domain-containing protein [Methylocella sp.]|nr:DUF2842 domain-containing protein [Methylocella sp.]
MRLKLRKLIGTGIVIAFVPAYALAAMGLAQSWPVLEASRPVQVLCYAVLGLAWILPLMPLIQWMEGGRSKKR